MNDEPKSIWKRPIKAWWFAARLVTLTGLTVVVFLATRFSLYHNYSTPPSLRMVWSLSIGIS